MVTADGRGAKRANRPPPRTYSPGLHVITHELVLIAQIQPAADDDRVRPAGFFADVIRLQRTLELVIARRCLNEGHLPALIAEYQAAIGQRDGSRAAAGTTLAATPDDFS